jgi:hypothetical protein
VLLRDNNSHNGFTEGDTQKILSPIDGVVDLCDNDKILLKTEKDVIIGENGLGENAEGEVLLLIGESKNNSEPSPIELHQLDADCIGKIILGEKFDREVLMKAIGMGVTGIVGLDIEENDISYITDRHLTTPVIKVSAPDFSKLLMWKGKKIYMQGSNKTILLLQL